MSDRYIKVAVTVIAGVVGMIASTKLSVGTSNSNRATEWPENAKAEPLTRSEFDWTVAHIRDDVGGIHNLLILTNSLLCALTVALVVGFF